MSSHLSRKVSRKITSTDEAIEEQSKDIRTESRSIHQLSKSYRGSRNFLDRSTQLSRICRDCDKKSLGSRQIARCRDSLKLVFQERENTDMNVIRHATQPKIQTIF